MKKALLLPFISFLLLVGCGNTETVSDPNNSQAQSTTLAKEESNSTETTSFKVGEKAITPDFSYSIERVVETSTFIDSFAQSIQTEDKFVLVVFRVTNEGSAPLQFSNDNAFSLVDENGIEYVHSVDLEQKYGRNINRENADKYRLFTSGMFVKSHGAINPGLTKTGYAIFEVPKDAKGLKLSGKKEATLALGEPEVFEEIVIWQFDLSENNTSNAKVGQPTNSTPSAPINKLKSDVQVRLDKDLLKVSATGNIPGVPFGMTSTIKEIEGTWGKADKIESLEGTDAHFYKDVIFREDSEDPNQLAGIIVNQDFGLQPMKVTELLGIPVEEGTNDLNGEYMLAYQTGKYVVTLYSPDEITPINRLMIMDAQ